VHYACGDRADEKYRVRFECAAGVLAIELRDRGPAFDPTSAAARDLDGSDGDRPAGGWGIHLVRHYIDDIRYAREGDENVLRMIKRLQSSPT
jgi:anti-sigma regulatory factor (Ser/Thr protein kinase)